MNKKVIETIFENILSNTINKCFYQNKFVRQALDKQFEEKFAKDNFIDYIQENIDEFKNIGFELSVEWIK